MNTVKKQLKQFVLILLFISALVLIVYGIGDTFFGGMPDHPMINILIGLLGASMYRNFKEIFK